MDVCDSLTDAVESFCAWAESLPEAETAPREWGVREVLAHLAYYHALYGEEVEAAMTGARLALPSGSYKELNARAAEAARDVPLRELTGRFRRANARLCHIYTDCETVMDPGKIKISIKQGAKAYELSWLIPEVERHIRGHLKDLQKAAKVGQGQAAA